MAKGLIIKWLRNQNLYTVVFYIGFILLTALLITQRIYEAIALFMALVALHLSIKSERQMNAISDLHFEEKMSVMAKYKDIAMHGRLDNLTPLLYDFKAVIYLFEYANLKKKEELIKDNLIPTLHFVVNGPMYLTEDDEDTIYEMIQLAMKYNIDTKRLEEIEGCLYWPLVSEEDRRKYHESMRALEEEWRKKLQKE